MREHVVSVSPKQMRDITPPVTIYRALCVCGWRSGRFSSMTLCTAAAYKHIRDTAESVPQPHTTSETPQGVSEATSARGGAVS